MPIYRSRCPVLLLRSVSNLVLRNVRMHRTCTTYLPLASAHVQIVPCLFLAYEGSSGALLRHLEFGKRDLMLDTVTQAPVCISI